MGALLVCYMTKVKRVQTLAVPQAVPLKHNVDSLEEFKIDWTEASVTAYQVFLLALHKLVKTLQNHTG